MHCLSDLLTYICEDDSESNRKQILLGFLSEILSKQNEYVSVQNLLDKASVPAECDIYFDQLLRPIGYLSWTIKLDLKAGSSVYRQRKCDKAITREQCNCCHIIDFCFRSGDIYSMLRGVRRYLLSVNQRVCYVRHKSSQQRQVEVTGKPGIRSVLSQRKDSTSEHELQKVTPDTLELCRGRLVEYAALGKGLIALSKSSPYANMSLKSAVKLLTTVGGIGQVRVYYNHAGEVTGLLTWAWMSQWTMERLVRGDLSPMHASEWNEGPILCFRDIAASSESAEQIAADLAGDLFPEEGSCAVMAGDRSSKKLVLVQIADSQRNSLRAWIMSQFNPNRSTVAPRHRSKALRERRK